MLDLQCDKGPRHGTRQPVVLILEYDQVRESGGSELFSQLTKYLDGPVEYLLIWETRWEVLTEVLQRIGRSRVLRFLRTRSRIAGVVFTAVTYRALLPRIKTELCRKYAGVPIRGIWSPSHELLPMLAMELAEELGCPFHISVFDLPHTFSLQKIEIEFLERSCELWAKRAASLDLASPAMKQHCDRFRSSASDRDLITWSSAGVAPSSSKRGETSRKIRTIAFCGSLRFFKEFNCLSDALALLEQRYGERVSLRLFSSKRLNLPGVEYMNFMSDRSVLEAALRECDVAYSPLSMDPNDALLVETSFPGKMATYLQADLPILAHAPSSAANHRFVVENGVGIGLDSFDPEWIAARIHKYGEEFELRQQHAQNCRVALEKFFSPAVRAKYFSTIFTESLSHAAKEAQ